MTLHPGPEDRGRVVLLRKGDHRVLPEPAGMSGSTLRLPLEVDEAMHRLSVGWTREGARLRIPAVRTIRGDLAHIFGLGA